MTFGITSTAGAASSGLIRRLTRGATGARLFCRRNSHPDDIYRSRDDKRYTEKKNKSERARRKKEDIARVRGLVDLCLR